MCVCVCLCVLVLKNETSDYCSLEPCCNKLMGYKLIQNLFAVLLYVV